MLNNESSPLGANCALKGRSISPLANMGELSGLKIQAEAWGIKPWIFNKRTIAWDNFNNEGHHKHYLNRKEIYKFNDLEETSNEFFALVEKFEKTLGEENDWD